MSTHSFVSRSSALRGLPCLLLLLSVSLVLPKTIQAQGAGYWHTSGNQILDANNQVVRIAGINWYGFETTRAVAGGLTSQDYKAILTTIHNQGYNTVRIPLSNQMVETPGVPSSISYSNGINADLQGLNSLAILDKIIAYAGTLNLRIILDNHRSEAGDSAESSGLWFTGQYPESAWINDWQTLARRYAGNPTVIGFDLRNEPHNAGSGGACWDCGGANDWHLAAARAGNAVQAINPSLLLFVEGTDAYNNDYYWWGGNLEGVRNSPVALNTPNHLVYSAHDYGPHEYGQNWFSGSTTYNSLYTVWLNHWAFISQNNIAPVWLGEFGTTNNAADIQNNAAGSQGQWFQSLVQFLGSDTLISWTYWALNGEDSYGLLDSNYDSSPASPLKQQSLASLQFALAGSGSSGGGGTTPPAPTNPSSPGSLTATAASSSQINLSWQGSSTTGVTYTVFASTSAGFTPSNSNAIATNLTGTAYNDTGLTASTTWYFVVEANKGGLNSNPTAQSSATTSAAPATPPATGGSSCHVVYTDQNDWGSGFTGGVTITNTGSSAITSWTLTWAYSGNEQLNNAWNSTYAQSGQVVTLTSMSYNGSIAPGATASGIGFNAAYSGSNPNPATFYLNGVLCK